MNENALLRVIEELVVILRERRIALVIVGGIATSVLAKPRATFDIDGIIDLPEEKTKSLLSTLRRKGFHFDQKQPLQQLGDLALLSLYHTRREIYIDLFVASNDFQRSILKRAQPIKINSLTLKVIAPEDLILMKLFSGREKDLEDIREIVMENQKKLDFRYLKDQAEALGLGAFWKNELQSLKIFRQNNS